MSMNQPKQHVRLPVALGGAALAITAAAVIAYVASFTDSKPKRTSDAVKEKVVAVLADADQSAYEPDANAQARDGSAKKLATLLKELPRLPQPARSDRSLDIPTTRDRARNGDMEAAKILIKAFDTMQRDRAPTSDIPSEKDRTAELEKIDEEILKELGVSLDELTLFRSADELRSRLDLMQSGGKLEARARELNDSGVRLLSGDNHEGVLSDLQYYMTMRLLCRQGGLGPSGENEALFLKLIGKSRQQLQDLAHSVYDYYYEDPNLNVDMTDMSCPDAIQETFGFAPSVKKTPDLELRE